MKIKGSVSKINTKTLLFTFLASIMICLPIRIIHVVKAIDVQTGFFTGYAATVTFFFTVLAIGCLAMAVFGFLAGKENYTLISPKCNKITGVFGLLVSLGFFLDFGFCFLTIHNSNHELSSATSQAAIKQIQSTIVPTRIEEIFAIISFVYFILFSIKTFKGKNTRNLKILAIAPVFCGIAKIITLLVTKISYIRISDLLLEITATVLLTVFYFSFAQFNSGIGAEIASWRIRGIGLPAALVSLVLNIPKFLFIITGSSDSYINQNYPINYVELFSGLFILCIILSFRSTTQTEELQAVEVNEITEKEQGHL